MATLVAGFPTWPGCGAASARGDTIAAVAQPLLLSGITMRRLTSLSRLKGVDFGLAFAFGIMIAMFT